MNKIIFVMLFINLFLSSKLFSQNFQVFKDDSTGVTTRIFEDDFQLRYFTHELDVRLDTIRRNNPEYRC